jgi:hypothetical protein
LKSRELSSLLVNLCYSLTATCTWYMVTERNYGNPSLQTSPQSETCHVVV